MGIYIIGVDLLFVIREAGRNGAIRRPNDGAQEKIEERGSGSEVCAGGIITVAPVGPGIIYEPYGTDPIER